MLLRGGGLERFTDNINSLGKPLHLLVTAFLLWWNLGLSWFILSGTIAMYLGESLGWGAYIQAIQGNETSNYEEVKPIDWLIKSLLSHPIIWGIVGLSFRGLIWTTALGVGLLDFWYIPIGLLMGPAYWLATKIKVKFIDEWGLGEIIFGIILGIGLILTGKRTKRAKRSNE